MHELHETQARRKKVWKEIGFERSSQSSSAAEKSSVELLVNPSALILESTIGVSKHSNRKSNIWRTVSQIDLSQRKHYVQQSSSSAIFRTKCSIPLQTKEVQSNVLALKTLVQMLWDSNLWKLGNQAIKIESDNKCSICPFRSQTPIQLNSRKVTHCERNTTVQDPPVQHKTISKFVLKICTYHTQWIEKIRQTQSFPAKLQRSNFDHLPAWWFHQGIADPNSDYASAFDDVVTRRSMCHPAPVY